MVSEYATELYNTICRKNKRSTVTVDDLLVEKSYSDGIKIEGAIQELRQEGFLTIKEVRNHGRFETELIPKDNYIEHVGKPAIKTNSIINKKQKAIICRKRS